MMESKASFWDVRPDGMLHVELVRSSVRHGRLQGLEVPQGMDAARVHLIDHRDCGPNNRFGMDEESRPILAARRVVHVGEPVAAIAASTEAEARVWADAVTIRVEERAEVADVEAALAARVRLRGDDNIYFEVGVRAGIDEPQDSGGFIALDETFNLARQLRNVMGTIGVVVEPHGDGALSVHANGGNAAKLTIGLAEALGLQESRIAVTTTADRWLIDADDDELLQLVVINAVTARKTGTPCRLLWRPTDRLAFGSAAPAMEIRLEGTLTSKGKGHQLRASLLLDGGAHLLLSRSSVLHALRQIGGPYAWRMVNSCGEAYATNNTPDYARTGDGFSQVVFAREQFMDFAAQRLSLTSAEVRIINLANPSKSEVLMLLEASAWVEASDSTVRSGRGLGYVVNDGLPAVDAVEVEVDAVTWEIRVCALHTWRVRGSAPSSQIRLNILKDVGLAGFEDASAAPFGIAAYRPGTSVELPQVHIHWIEGDPVNPLVGVPEDAPATGAASAFVSAVARATGLRATDLPLLPEVLVDLHLIHADHEEVVH